MIQPWIRLFQATAIFLTIAAAPAHADDKAPKRKGMEAKPLFTVALKEKFPEGENTLDEVMDLVIENYYSDTITRDALYWAAIEGILRHLSPPKSPELGQIWTPVQYDRVSQALRGVQISIGIKSSFNSKDGSLTVSSILEGSPAIGLLEPYDRIMRIDGVALKGKTVKDIDDLLYGDKGTVAKLKIVRGIEIKDVEITRKEFKTKNLIVAQLPESVAYIRMKRFTAGVSKEMKEILAEIAKKKTKRLIIDLRDNRGGVFSESMKTAELFLKEKDILLRTYTRAKRFNTYVSANKNPFSFDTAILVNQNTASSCEIFSSAMRDHGKAIIIGQKTHGKGVMEKTFTLENKYRLKFIIGALYTPLGKNWQSRGLAPDIRVPQRPATFATLVKSPADKRLKRDAPLLAAWDILRKR